MVRYADKIDTPAWAEGFYLVSCEDDGPDKLLFTFHVVDFSVYGVYTRISPTESSTFVNTIAIVDTEFGEMYVNEKFGIKPEVLRILFRSWGIKGEWTKMICTKELIDQLRKYGAF